MRVAIPLLLLGAIALAGRSETLLFGSESAPDCEWILTEQGDWGLELELRINRAERVDDAGGERLLVDGLEREGRPGEAWLPGGARLLAVPARASLALDVVDVESVALDGFSPRPRPAWTSDFDGRECFAAERSTPAPADWARLSDPAVWLGQRVVGLDVDPVRFDEQAGTWRMATRLRVRVAFGAGEGVDPGREGRAPGRAARGLLSAAVLNPGGLAVAAADRDGALEPLGRYLVVGPAASLPFLDDWVQLRREQGFDVELRSKEELGVGNENWQPIRAAAQELYDGDGLDFLLLIGDMNQNGSGYHLPGDMVPGGQHAEWNWGREIVSDHSMALLDGDDYFADVLVGRLTADNATQLATMVNRGLQYETEPMLDDPDWLRRALMVYDVSGAGTRRETSLCVRHLLQEAGVADVDTINNNRDEWPQSPALVSSALNAGLAFVNYRGFGYRNAWNGPAFDSQHILALSNFGQWPLFTSMVCGGGDFASTNYEPCLGEAALQAGTVFEPVGGIAFIGPSEEDTHSQWNNCIDLGLYEGLVSEGLRLPSELMERGKLELWLNFPNDREENWLPAGAVDQATNVPFYHWCYNLLGDPGIELRMGGQSVVATAVPDELPEGLTRLELVVRDGAGQRLEGVVGCLSGEFDERLALGWSDAAGQLVLDFAPLAGDAVTLLLHGRDLVPLRAEIPLQAAASHLDLRAWRVTGGDPDDGLLSPGESATLDVELIETGAEGAAGRRLRLETLVDGLETDGVPVELETSAPGDTLRASLPLALAPSLEDGATLALRFHLEDADGEEIWNRRLDLVAAGQRCAVDDHAVVNGVIGPGSEAGVVLQVRNDGSLPLVAETLHLYSTSEAATVLEAESAGLDLASGESATVGPYSFAVDAAVLPGSLLPFELVAFRADGGTACRTPLQLQAGERGPEDPYGPDGHGYAIHHSAQTGPDAPVHEWTDISALGEEIVLEDQGESFNEEGIDGDSRAVSLPFDFRFYGQDFDTVTVCSNGWMGLGAQEYCYTGLNTDIPAAQGPSGMIAAFWTDLYNQFNATRFGHVYGWHDEEGHRYIVQWDNLMHTGYPWNSNWFQVVLLDPVWHPTPTGDGEILLVYHDLVTGLGQHGFTVGIESPDRRDGLCYAFNGETAEGMPPVEDGVTLRVAPVQPFGETAVEDGAAPRDFRLLGVAPNPFNPTTVVRLQLPAPGRLGWSLYNLTGQLALSGAPRRTAAGEAALTVDGSGLASGVYLLRAEWRPDAGPVRWAETKLLLVK